MLMASKQEQRLNGAAQAVSKTSVGGQAGFVPRKSTPSEVGAPMGAALSNGTTSEGGAPIGPAPSTAMLFPGATWPRRHACRPASGRPTPRTSHGPGGVVIHLEYVSSVHETH